MDGLIQVYIMLLLLGFYSLLGAVVITPVMALVTYIKKDKAYFTKKIDKFWGIKK